MVIGEGYSGEVLRSDYPCYGLFTFGKLSPANGAFQVGERSLQSSRLLSYRVAKYHPLAVEAQQVLYVVRRHDF